MRPPRPQTGRPNYGGGRPPARPASTQFGPSNAIKMLPAPNLAGLGPPPQAGGRPGSLGSPSLDPGPGSPARPAGPDSYGAPQARPIAAAPTDSYGAPEAAPISTGDSYGAPAAAPVTAGGDSYGSPAASPVTGGGEELLAAVGAAGLQPQYGAGALNTYASPGAEPIISDNSDTAAPAIDSYGGAVGPVVSLPNLDPSPAPAPAPDSYGGAVAPVLEAAPAPAYDDYDPSDIPADQAAPVITDNAAAPAVDIDDYDPSDIPADQAEPLAGYGRDAVDVYGSALAPVGTSAPVPDEIFTVDSNAPSSIDSYSPTEGEEFSLSEPASVEVIDLSVSPRLEEVETTVAPTDALFEEQEAVATTLAPTSPASLLPPVAEGELVEQEVDTATPTAAPVLFTYAPEGSTASEAEPRVNIVVASGEEGSSLLDPLNVIPDQYEGEYAEEEADYLADYNDYDPADIPPDQAEIVEDLSSYVGNDLGSVDDSESLGAAAGPAPAPAFDDLRGISFTTGGLSALSDPEPTTYRSPIDFDFGTTAAEGIEVGDVVLREEDGSGFPGEYEVEEETDYAAGGQDIPIVVEEAVTEESALPTYDPVVLLVGTPEKEDESKSQAAELPLYENTLEEKSQSKRKAKKPTKKSSLRERYNNWFGPRNDWSRKIQKVQGRIRYKKLNQQRKS